MQIALAYKSTMESDIGASVTRTLGKRKHAVAAGLAVVAAGWLTAPIWNWERYVLPPTIDVDQVLASRSQSGLREGCQAALYRLSKDAAQHLRAGGVNYLNSGQRPQNESVNNPYTGWIETPGQIGLSDDHNSNRSHSYWIGAKDSGCTNGDPIDGGIGKAITIPGSFYNTTANGEGIIIVVPAKLLVAYYYWG